MPWKRNDAPMSLPSRATGLTVLLVTSALAGCVTPVTPPDPSHGGADIRFGPPVVIDSSKRGFEPAVAVDTLGTIFVCSLRGAPYGTDLWRSRDGGNTFEYLGLEIAPRTPVLRSGSGDVGGGDCDLGIDAGNRVYMADLWAGSASVVASSDGGDTWQGTPVSQLGPNMDRPWVLGGAADEVFVTGAQVATSGFEQHGLNAPAVGGLWVSRSTDGGLTFPQRVLAVSNEDRLQLNGNLATDGENLYLLYTKKVGEGTLAVVVAISEDRGLTWRESVAATQSFEPGDCSPLVIFPIIAADPDGGVYAAWVLNNPETRRADLFFVASPDRGEHWHEPTQVTDRPGARGFPWLEAAGQGAVGLVWYETNVTSRTGYTGDATGAAGLTCEWLDLGEAEWFVHYAFTGNAPAASPTFSEALVDARAVHRGQLDRPYAERIDLAFDLQGRAAVVYVADVPEGTARPMFALQVDGPSGRMSRP